MNTRMRSFLDSRRAAWLILLGVALLVQGAALLWSRQIGGDIGFPADDAWIHQVYARSIAQHGTIAFNHGELSTGDSSPLWMLLLVPGSVWQAAFAWTFLLGGIASYLTALLVLELAPFLFKTAHARWWGLVAATLTLVEWHLLWAALSGMETPLFVMLTLLMVYLAWRGAAWWLLGVAAGLGIATRPEAVLLLGLIMLFTWRKHAWSAWLGIIGCAVLLNLPFWGFNWVVGGSFLPNTFSAKSVDDVVQPWYGLTFLFEYAAMLVIGLNITLIPAILFWLQAPREEKRRFWLPLLWCGALLAMYTILLPIPYHHLRYMMPTLPWLILLSVAGLARLASLNAAVAKLQLGMTAVMSLVLVGFGINVFAYNVQNINAMQREVGLWLRTHTEPGARVAADEIGAIGYFSDRYVVDLVGLVTPGIVPLKRARQPLSPFLCTHKVDYFAIYPGKHDEFDSFFHMELAYTQEVPFNTINPDSRLLVYRVRDCSAGQ